MKPFRQFLLIFCFLGISAWSPVAAAGPQDRKTHVVTIENMRFSPDVIRMAVGDVVEFRNRDLVPHSATEVRAGGFDSGMISPGANWKMTILREGSFPYHCLYHPEMKGEVAAGSAARIARRNAPAFPEICGNP